jgi:uncharacterized protein (DUF2384 family)
MEIIMTVTFNRKAPETEPKARSKVTKAEATLPTVPIEGHTRPLVSYGEVFRATHGERFALLSEGLPANVLFSTINDLGIPQERVFQVLKLPRSSMLRIKKSASQHVLNRDEGSLVLGLRQMIGQVEVMVKESGAPEGFNAAKWLATWLETPNSALGGRLPADYMHQKEGQELIAQLLSQMQSGAYA